MVAQWIPVSKGLHRKREVIAISQAVNRSRYEVAGILVAFWSWADEESADGQIPGMNLDSLQDIIEGTDRRFWECVKKEGWLIETADGLEVPNFTVWLGHSAKKRLKEKTRKNIVREMSDSKRTKNGQKAPHRTEQNRTELGEESPSPSCPEPQAASGPVDCSSGNGGDASKTSAQDRNNAPADGKRIAPVAASSVEAPPVLIFPTVGADREWFLTKELIEEFCYLFPAVDVPGECRKALAWVLAAAAHRKTAKGMRRFLTGWLTRTSDRGQQKKWGGDGQRDNVGRSSRIESQEGKYSRIGKEVGAMPSPPTQGTAAILAAEQTTRDQPVGS